MLCFTAVTQYLWDRKRSFWDFFFIKGLFTLHMISPGLNIKIHLDKKILKQNQFPEIIMSMLCRHRNKIHKIHCISFYFVIYEVVTSIMVVLQDHFCMFCSWMNNVLKSYGQVLHKSWRFFKSVTLSLHTHTHEHMHTHEH